MIKTLGAALSKLSEKAVPDPFVLALILTLGVFAYGFAVTPAGSSAMLISAWIDGFSSKPLLAFALQMSLVLVTGHAFATAPLMQRVVAALAGLPRSAGQAAALVAFVACVSAVIHWGLGAIVGAILAREMGRHAESRGLKVHYPLLGGAAYAGLAVWHGGLSGSAPLKVAEEGHFAVAHSGVLPVSETLFSSLNLVVTGTLCVLIPILFFLMTPKEEDFEAPEASGALPTQEAPPVIDSIPRFLQERVEIGRVVGTLGLVMVGVAWNAGEIRLGLNMVNLVFLFAGIGLQGSVRCYVDAVADGARGAGAIIVQFPFYFGILGVMKASGAIASISAGLVAFATKTTFPIVAFASAGIVNLLVPSGGGQWAVQGEVLLSAGAELGVSPALTVMAFSYGDAFTNMLQPFWALPLLGIMGLPARKIIGYTGVVCLMMLIVVPGLLLAFG